MERHVDLWTKRPAVHIIPSPGTTKAPVPNGDEGLEAEGAALLRVPPPASEGWGAGRVPPQRQRIDITRPTTMAPKPIAKFQAPSETISGILSPAT